MTEHIGLKEAIQIVTNTDPQKLGELVHDERLIGFYDSLNECGTNALKPLGAKEALSAIEFIQIATVLQLITRYAELGDFKSVGETMSLSASEVFQDAIQLAVKSGIGLSIMEELH